MFQIKNVLLSSLLLAIVFEIIQIVNFNYLNYDINLFNELHIINDKTVASIFFSAISFVVHLLLLSPLILYFRYTNFANKLFAILTYSLFLAGMAFVSSNINAFIFVLLYLFILYCILYIVYKMNIKF